MFFWTIHKQAQCFLEKVIRQQQFYFFPLRFCETFFLGAHNFCVLTFSVWIIPWLIWNLWWNCHYKNIEKSLFTVFLSFLLMNHWEDFNGCKLWKVIRYESFERCHTFSWEFIKILSITVEEVPVILVASLIWGVKLF